MFNFSGSELVFLLLLALIILGPEKLPDAVRKFGKTYAEFKKVTTGFQSELRQVLDEPMKEMRETADLLKKSANFDAVSEPATKPVSGSMAAATPTPPAQAVQPPFQRPQTESTPEGGSPTAAAAPPVSSDDVAPGDGTAAAGTSASDQAVEAAVVPPPRPAGPAFHSAAPPRRDPVDAPQPTSPGTEPGQEEPST